MVVGVGTASWVQGLAPWFQVWMREEKTSGLHHQKTNVIAIKIQVNTPTSPSTAAVTQEPLLLCFILKKTSYVTTTLGLGDEAN